MFILCCSLCFACADEPHPSGGSHSNRKQEGQRLGSGSGGSAVGSRDRPPPRRFADRSKVGAEEPEDGDNKQGSTRGGRGGRRGGGRGGLSRGGGSGAASRNGKREFDRRSGSDKRCVVLGDWLCEGKPVGVGGGDVWVCRCAGGGGDSGRVKNGAIAGCLCNDFEQLSASMRFAAPRLIQY